MTTIAPYRIRVKVPSTTRRFEPRIGLEVHVQLKTKTKLFCGDSTEFGAKPNQNTCPVCTGMPGALPVINETAVTLAIKAALALNMTVNNLSVFSRKSYFYPDLPKGYQISQYELPLASNGHLDITVGGITTRIRISRAHLEEDAGKLVHVGSVGILGSTGTLVDFNRSGVPLLEIVSEADIRSPEQAVEYFRVLRDILVITGVTEGKMQEGNLRCDANLSLRRIGTNSFGTKVEIKNLNSFRFLRAALEYEIRRQAALLASGQEVVQETRSFDPVTGETTPMRTKEESQDYRYFPEPDLLPLEISPEWIERVRREMPILPHQRRERYENMGLERKQIELLLSDMALASFFDDCLVRVGKDDVLIFAKWFLNVFIGELSRSGRNLSTMEIDAGKVVRIYKLMRNSEISPASAVSILRRCLVAMEDPDYLVDRDNLRLIKDEDTIARKVDEIMAANMEKVAEYRSGKKKLFGYFMGEVMRTLEHKADAQLVEKILQKKLNQ